MSLEILGYLVALLMGFSMGLIGAGGSILIVPTLVYFFRQDAVNATAGSLFIVGMTALVGAILSARRGLVDYKTGFIFAAPSFVGVFFSRAILLPWIPDEINMLANITISKSFLVLASFAVLMLFAAQAMIRQKKVVKDAEMGPANPLTFREIAFRGFLVGTMTGFVGAGGGFLIIPALVMLLHLPIRVAIGTSLAIIAANSFFGFMISYGEYPIQWPILLIITTLGILGLLIGQKVSPHVNDQKLKKGFGYFVLIIGLFILVEQLF